MAIADCHRQSFGHALGDPRMLNPATATSLARRAVTRKAFFKPGVVLRFVLMVTAFAYVTGPRWLSGSRSRPSGQRSRHSGKHPHRRRPTSFRSPIRQLRVLSHLDCRPSARSVGMRATSGHRWLRPPSERCRSWLLVWSYWSSDSVPRCATSRVTGPDGLPCCWAARVSPAVVGVASKCGHSKDLIHRIAEMQRL